MPCKWVVHIRSLYPREEHTLQKHRDFHGRSIALLFKKSQARVDNSPECDQKIILKLDFMQRKHLQQSTQFHEVLD